MYGLIIKHRHALLLMSLISCFTLEIGLVSATPLSDEQIAAINDGRKERRDFLIKQEISRPFPSITKSATYNNSDIAVDTQNLGRLNFVLAAFMHHGQGEVEKANQEFHDALQDIFHSPTFKGVTKHHIPGTPADNDSFHFEQAQFIYRIVKMFGSHGTIASGILQPVIEMEAATLMFNWGKSECHLSDADIWDTWRIWGSENHGAQRDGACWATASLLVDTPQMHNKVYDDGSKTAEQLNAWTAYIKQYLRQRGTHGTLIEYFSPTYAKYTLLNFYMYFDFSADLNLKELARETLDLWWALWGQEQIDSIHGGSKTRAYPSTIGKAMVMQSTGWLYFNIGPRPVSQAPGEAAMTGSTYAPPSVVIDIAVDTDGRGEYDVLTRSPGLVTKPMDTYYHIDPNDEEIVRIAHITPDFVMGTTMLPKLPTQKWAAISSQNRWNGLIMAGGNPKDSITVLPEFLKKGSQYNAIWGVQSSATQILQAIPSTESHNAGGIRVWFGDTLKREERDGWIYINGPAYVAVRPAWGNYFWEKSDGHWMIPSDGYAPIIIQAASAKEYPTLEAFQSAIRHIKLSVNEDILHFHGLQSMHSITFYCKSGKLPEIDGKTIDLKPKANFQSPFVNSIAEDVVINKNGRSEKISFLK
ncbi:hypothetical protein [Komagataeibacter xylinus]|uniref:hypothetical protein n=1 Tax=Komagataeibacter xylinus TaxID=28448 RepID=UPI000A6A852D|nr:hypothetical protein [Komagataeibacter xylinus]GBQ70647.1 hypothetical protein AA15237_0913 [Komagataeibacter xylinus NBRC 15237]